MKKNKITVICLHRVTDEFSPSWAPLKVNVFENLLKYISKHYEVISFNNLSAPFKNNKPKLILTFDDGYKDFILFALPMLQKYKLPAVLNVVVGAINNNQHIWTQRLNKAIEAYINSDVTITVDKKDFIIKQENINSVCTEIFLLLLNHKEDERNIIIENIEKYAPGKISHTEMLSWDDLKTCMDNDIEIGSHSLTHYNLSDKSDMNRVGEEIVKSKQMLKEKLYYEPLIIAYPNGQYNNEVIELSKQAGYKFMLLIDEKLYDPDENKDSSCYLIPRILIQHNTYIENCFKIENFHNVVKSFKL